MLWLYGKQKLLKASILLEMKSTNSATHLVITSYCNWFEFLLIHHNNWYKSSILLHSETAFYEDVRTWSFKPHFRGFCTSICKNQSTMIYNWFLLQEQFFITTLWFLPFYAIVLLYLITSLTYFKLDFYSQKMILRARLVLSDMSAYFVDLITPSKKSYKVCMSYKHNVHCMPRLEVAYRLGTSIHHLFLPPLLNISFKNNLPQS